MNRFLRTASLGILATFVVMMPAHAKNEAAQLSKTRLLEMIEFATVVEEDDLYLFNFVEALTDRKVFPLACHLAWPPWGETAPRPNADEDWTWLNASKQEVRSAMRVLGNNLTYKHALVQTRYVTSATLNRVDGGYKGLIQVLAPGVYKGQFEYFAVLSSPGRWTLQTIKQRGSGGAYQRNGSDWIEVTRFKTTKNPTNPDDAKKPDATRVPTWSRLPSAQALESKIEVAIDNNGRIRVDGKDATHPDLLRATLRVKMLNTPLREDGGGKTTIAFLADEGTSWRAMKWAIALCLEDGIRVDDIRVAVRESDSGKMGLVPISTVRTAANNEQSIPSMDLGGLSVSLCSSDPLSKETLREPDALRRATFSVMSEHTALSKTLGEENKASKKSKKSSRAKKKKRKSKGVSHRKLDSAVIVAVSPRVDSHVSVGDVVQAIDAISRARKVPFLHIESTHASVQRLLDGLDVDRVSDASKLEFAKKIRVPQRRHVICAVNGVPFFESSRKAATPRASIDEQAKSLPPEELPAENVESPAWPRTLYIREFPGGDVFAHDEIEDLSPRETAMRALDLVRFLGVNGGAFPGRHAARELIMSNKTHSEIKCRRSAEEALKWLAAHQSPDGSWHPQDYGRWCDGKPRVERGGGGCGKLIHKPGITGLALCAFLGAGYSGRGKHPFTGNVRRGLQYLRSIQNKYGVFDADSPTWPKSQNYCQAICTMAMLEAYGMSGSKIELESAQRALDLTAKCRNPYFAWRYGARPGDNDTSVTAWMCHAYAIAKAINKASIRSGAPAPIKYDEGAFEGVSTWLDKVIDPDTGRAGYQSRGALPHRYPPFTDRFPGSSSECPTAAAIMMRAWIGDKAKTKKRSMFSNKGGDGSMLCMKCLPKWTQIPHNIDMCYWYFGSLAMYQLGGKYWKAWEKALLRDVLPHQVRTGTYCAKKGSWDPVGVWGESHGGRVFSTAMMAMCFETHSRYAILNPKKRRK